MLDANCLISSVTGVKKETRLPKIFDERLDTLVKIIVLDLRTNADPNRLNENVPTSNFKKMPSEIWDNVVQISKAFKPNQATDCPIQTAPPSSIDVYTNILPKQQQNQQQLLKQQSPMLPATHQMSPFNNNNNNAGMFHPGMMYGNMLPSTVGSPLLFNQPNYLNVMAAAQSIVNAATAYNNMFMSNFNPHQQMLSPQPQHLLSPQSQHMISPQNQHVQLMQNQQQQQSNSQIKRKPVQYQQPTSYLSPQIEQRLLRKKGLMYSQQQPLPQPQAQPQRQQQPQPRQPAQRQQGPKVKKSVQFAENPTIYTYEPEEEYEGEQPGYQQHELHQHSQANHHYQDERRYYHYENDGDNYEPFYTQHPAFNNNHQSSRQPPQQYRNNDYYYRQHNEPEEEEEEEDHGALWRRRNFLQRQTSNYKSRA
ncbi:hypothetical protein [Parasitella parasitica]|uniref:Uncharacterized protein n=1 Tax=Parasitella parasitica TaxID=35722 RepID=A0A0B7MTU2_9FUNG|nr:hypothetical protein [Parasitella parasitica]